jgi:hypothetical protein
MDPNIIELTAALAALFIKDLDSCSIHQPLMVRSFSSPGERESERVLSV